MKNGIMVKRQTCVPQKGTDKRVTGMNVTTHKVILAYFHKSGWHC